MNMPSLPLPSFLQDRLDVSSLLQGAGAALVIYVCIFVVLGFTGGHVIEDMEAKLASASVAITTGQQRETQSAPVSVTEQIPSHQQALPEQHAEDSHDIAAQHTTAQDKPEAAIESPFDTYKRPFTPVTGRPMIAIAVNDYGLSGEASAAALESLPPDVSLILSPYAENPRKAQKQARDAGHEIWIGLPVQDKDFPLTDPGPQALLSDSGLQYNQQRLDWVLDRTSGYAGVAASIDSSFNDAPTLIQKLFGSIFEKGLGYFEINPAANTAVETIAIVERAPYVRNDVFLDQTSLKSLENTARQKGYVVGVVPPSPGHIQALKVWLETLPGKGISVVPLSAIASSSTH